MLHFKAILGTEKFFEGYLRKAKRLEDSDYVELTREAVPGFFKQLVLLILLETACRFEARRQARLQVLFEGIL